MEALWASLNPLSSPFVLWGLCALMSSPQVSPVYHGACVHLSLLPVPAICFVGLVFTCLSSLCPPSASRVLCAFVLSHLPDLFVTRLMCSSLDSPGLPSVLRGLCVLQGFVHHATLGYLGLPSVSQVLCALTRFVCLPHSVPQVHCLVGATIRELFMGWKCSFLCFLPSKSLLCQVSQDSASPPWAHLRGSFPVHGNSSCFRTPSLPWGISSCPEDLPLSPFYVSIVSPTSFQGA